MNLVSKDQSATTNSELIPEIGTFKQQQTAPHSVWLPLLQFQSADIPHSCQFYDEALSFKLHHRQQIPMTDVAATSCQIEVLEQGTNILLKSVKLQFAEKKQSDGLTEIKLELNSLLLELAKESLVVSIKSVQFEYRVDDILMVQEMTLRGFSFLLRHPYCRIKIQDILPQQLYVGGLYEFQLKATDCPQN